MPNATPLAARSLPTLESLESRRLLSADAAALSADLGQDLTIHASGCFCPICAGTAPAIEVDVLSESALVAGLSDTQALPPAATASSPLALSAVTVSGGDYDIVVEFSPDTAQIFRDQIEIGARKWESILLGDVPDVYVNDGIFTGVVDDLHIYADVSGIDGPGGTLGQAGPRSVRPAGENYLPATGFMQFDSADSANLVSANAFVNVVVHEIGHILGIGTIWRANGLLSGRGTSDPTLGGANAVAEYDRFSRAGESRIPVENNGGGGTRDSHWRESTFDNELMTGFLNFGRANPLSRMTAANMIDMGYPEVDVDATDLYELPSSNANRNRLPGASSLSAGNAGAAGTNAGVRLTAGGVGDVDGTVASVSFYRESNGRPGLQAGTSTPDELVAVDTSSAGGWAATLADRSSLAGGQIYYARAADDQGALSGVRSASFTYVRDTVAPAVTSGGFEFQTGQVVRFAFSEPVTVAASGGLRLTNLETGQSFSVSAATSDGSTGATTSYEFRPSGGLLPDGNYVAALEAGQVRDRAGNALSGGDAKAATEFFVLAGDATRDRRVDLADFLVLRQNFGRAGNTTFGGADFDYSGRVDLGDFLILRRQFGLNLPAAPAAPGSLFGGVPITGGDNGEGGEGDNVVA